MKKIIPIALILISLGIPLNAILPPLYQTSKEISSIMASDELGRALTSADVIMRIDKIDSGYLITTNKRRLSVDVVYEPQQHPGPAQFTLHFNKTLPL